MSDSNLPPHRICSAFGDDAKCLLLPPPPNRIASASGDHGKDSRNSTSSTWQLCISATERGRFAIQIFNTLLFCSPYVALRHQVDFKRYRGNRHYHYMADHTNLQL